jgi:hypothetical protein
MSLNKAMYWTAERIQAFLKITLQDIHEASQSVTAEAIRLLQLRLKGIQTEFADCYTHHDWMFPTRKIKIFERIRCPSHYGNWSPGRRNKTLWRHHCHTSPTINTKYYILFVFTTSKHDFSVGNFFIFSWFYRVQNTSTGLKWYLFCVYKR